MHRASEVLVEFDEAITSDSGAAYHARVLGAPGADGLWTGWLEFSPAGGDRPALETDRETTQPNRTDLAYWAAGLSRVYLQGALTRALDHAGIEHTTGRPRFDATGRAVP